MRIAIISYNIHSVWSNYGAVLHSWAFQQTLLKLGYESKILDYVVDDFKKYNFKYPALSKGTLPIRNRIVLLANVFMYASRYAKFKNFFEENYNKTSKQYNKDNVSELDFDIYICESDVLWSPVSIGGMDRMFFFDYPNMAKKLKIAYSVSMGDMHFDDKSLSLLKRKIANFDYVSVREKTAKDFLNKNIKTDVEHVLDPVFLLNENDYNSLLIDKAMDEDYVLVYSINRTKGLMKTARNISEYYNAKLIIISDFFIYSIYGKTRNNASITEFLTLFKNAKYVITNTFHGASFAIVFNKNFVVYSRYNKNAKIKSVLETTSLNNQLLEEGVVLKKPIEIDSYKTVNARLRKEKEKSIHFIKKALSI